MSNFTPLVTQEYEFEGDTVSITFSRLKRKDMIGAMPALQALQQAKEAEDNELMGSAINDVLNSIVDVIPDYVKEFSGLNDVMGEPVPIETVCSEFYFVKLVMQIAIGMLEVSSGKEGKV